MGTDVHIHPTAIVDPKAKLGVGVHVGAYAFIGPQVVLEDHVWIDHHASITSRTRVGEHTKIFPFATVGSLPQDLKYKGEDTLLQIGSHNHIREYVNINIGTESGGGQTIVGAHNLFMVYTHIAHDCIIGDHCIIANSVQLAGHVEVDSRAVIGGAAAVHQFVKIGALAMVGGGSMVAKDVAPYFMVQGDRAKTIGLNVVGLKRSQMSGADMKIVKDIFHILMKENKTKDVAVETIKSKYSSHSLGDLFLTFMQRSNRGLCPISTQNDED